MSERVHRCRRPVLSLVAIVLASSFGCQSSEGPDPAARETTTRDASELRLAYITNGVASFWTVAEAGVRAGEKDFGVRCDVLMPTEGSADQKRMVEGLLARGVDGIAISPIDADNQTDFLNQAARNTILITQDCDAPDADRRCYIGTDNYQAGRMAGQLVKEVLPDGGSVAIFLGRLEQVNGRMRRQGVIDELLDRSNDPTRYDEPGEQRKGEKYVIVDTRTDQLEPSRAKANAEDMITAHPDLDCMVGLFAYNPPQCLAAIDAAGKQDQIRVVGFDEDFGTLQGILDGRIHGTVVQDAFGYGHKSVEVLKALAMGDDSIIPANAYIEFPPRQIRKGDVQAFWDDLKAKMQAAEGARQEN